MPWSSLTTVRLCLTRVLPATASCSPTGPDVRARAETMPAASPTVARHSARSCGRPRPTARSRVRSSRSASSRIGPLCSAGARCPAHGPRGVGPRELRARRSRVNANLEGLSVPFQGCLTNGESRESPFAEWPNFAGGMMAASGKPLLPADALQVPTSVHLSGQPIVPGRSTHRGSVASGTANYTRTTWRALLLASTSVGRSISVLCALYPGIALTRAASPRRRAPPGPDRGRERSRRTRRGAQRLADVRERPDGSGRRRVPHRHGRCSVGRHPSRHVDDRASELTASDRSSP